MRRPVVLAAALALASPAFAAGKVAPETIVRSCPPVRVAGKAVSVDVISGTTNCTVAGAEIRSYVATKPRAGRSSRSLTVAGIRLSCRAFAPGSGFAWRYVCMTPAFAATGGGRLLPAADYRKS